MGSKIDYEFNALNPTQFELILEFPFHNRLIQNIFNKSKSKLMKKGVTFSETDPGSVPEFDADERYLKLIKTIIGGKVNQIFKEVKKDGIHILGHEVVKCNYKRHSSTAWKTTIRITGDYADKRGVK